MEELLHYIWKHKILPLRELLTSDGRVVEVLNPGIRNTNAGPDFTNAKIKIDGTEWIGNVEIHVKTSDWFRHHHDKDENYEHIILHVASVIDQPLFYPNGMEIPQLQIDVPQYIRDNYAELRNNDFTPRCRNIVSTLPAIHIHNWLTTLTLERFEERTLQIMQRREQLDKNWEDTLFVTLARNFGFGINGDAFEQWAQSIPMNAVAKHRDDLFQIEAIFFGQAGLLSPPPPEGGESRDERQETKDIIRMATPPSGVGGLYFAKLQKEYRYLRQKFSLTPMDPSVWKFLRLRPQNFPHIRIAQLAMMYYEQRLNLSKLINTETLDEVNSLLLTHVSDYWKTHYSFSPQTSRQSEKHLSQSSLNLIIINTVAPIMFAYGKYKSDQKLCQKAFALWQDIKAEQNHITRQWETAGVTCQNAGDSQALIQLTKRYCQTRDCLRCQFGYEYIRHTPGLLCEEPDKTENESKQ